ncbi:uncharacterized protein LOC123512878 [Portunus trituberculatus]|uniref:uncharacterized protein LOC123512878 n=1 Tax=Portunus trituberculatus TaxID=210409 RepID=UPI001E1CFD02|nr:uncharacterized protein LOC123512878 [Portunus trituberculatus]
MKSFGVFLLLVGCCLAASSVSRDGMHGVSSHAQPQSQPLSSSYEGPPPPYDTQPALYEQPPQTQHSQFSYHSFQPNYVEPAWHTQETGLFGSWVEKGLSVLGDLLPVAVSVFAVLAIFTFLGLIKVPYITSISEAREHLGRALANVDVDHLANTVTMAIDKYREMFGDTDY